MKKTIEVVAAAIHENDKYFCVKRNEKGELPGKWEFPGGKVEKGESTEAALKREILEEFDTLINIEKHLLTTEYEYTSFNIILHVFLAKRAKGELKLLEHTKSVWLNKDELLSLDWAPADIPSVEVLVNLKD